MTYFDGVTYEAELDQSRLSSQLERVRAVMSSGEWYTLAQIAQAVGGSEASVSARLRDLRKDRFGACEVERRRVEGGLFVYRVNRRDPQQLDLIGGAS